MKNGFAVTHSGEREGVSGHTTRRPSHPNAFYEGVVTGFPRKLGIAVQHLTTAYFLSKQPEPPLWLSR